LPYEAKVEPPLDEIEVETRFPRDRSKSGKPYLVVSFDCLEAILLRENSVIAEEDVLRLLAALCGYAIAADVSDHALAGRMKEQYEEQIDDDD
jgi:hypothetical protein